MTQQFESAWWSVELPTGWVGEREDTCADLWSENGVGALQVSAYQRENEAVTWLWAWLSNPYATYSCGLVSAGLIVYSLEQKTGADTEAGAK